MSSVADIIVECFVILDPVGYYIVLLVEFCKQVLGRYTNPLPFLALGGIVLKVRDLRLVSICVYCALGLGMR